MLSVTVETIKTVAIVAMIVFVVLAVITARLMASIVAKLIAVAIFAALAIAVWTQRQSLTDCAATIEDQARAAQASGDLPGTTTCTFFGYDVEVTLPEG